MRSEGEGETGNGQTGKVRLVLDASGRLPSATELPAAPSPRGRATPTVRAQVWANTDSERQGGLKTGGQGAGRQGSRTV